ncbi:hypothetical protein [Metamycoplasma gateae]|uniref:Restriction endonuclease n=1 Tax=Metamycoplasma gateae TaxID=35769 RepID=A0ABZ2AKG6_9BACT|nr:hypothetical protein V2E26_03055 [Metamycoplasma gateae]
MYNQNNDGRVDSANNEKITSYLRQNNLYAKIPSIREWYDLLIHSNNDDIYCPINIKLSNLIGNDNLNCKLGIYFALTGSIPNFSNEINWSKFLIKLYNDIKENERDYYFLIINKKNIKDIYYNSLKRIKEFISNGNNLPFQCDWNKNKIKTSRSFEESKQIIMKSFFKSAKNRAKLYFEFCDIFKDIEG